MTTIYTDNFGFKEINIDLSDQVEDGRELIFNTSPEQDEIRIVLNDQQLRDLGKLLELEGYANLPVDGHVD